MCVAHTVAVRGGPRGPGVPRAATTCPSPGHRTDLEVKVLRQKGLPFVIEEGTIRNLYTLQIQNQYRT